MNATDLLHRIGETLGSTATVKSVFGDPISAHDRTVVPIAKVSYGFGGGFGARKDDTKADRAGEGAAGGGGVRAYPAGALEISARGTRFIPFVEVKWLAAVFAAGAIAGALARPRRRRLT